MKLSTATFAFLTSLVFFQIFTTTSAQCSEQCRPKFVADRQCRNQQQCSVVKCDGGRFRNFYKCTAGGSSGSTGPVTCPNKCDIFRSRATSACRSLGSKCSVQRCSNTGRKLPGWKCAEGIKTDTKCPTQIGRLVFVRRACNRARRAGLNCVVRPNQNKIGTFACEDPTAPPVEPKEITGLGVGTIIDLNFTFTVEPGSGTPSEDIYFIVDGTNPSAISSLASGAQSIIDARGAASSNVNYGLGVYTGTAGSSGFNNVLSLTSNSDAFKNQLNSLSATSGSGSGALLNALNTVATGNVGFRNIARKIIVVVGSAPGYEPTCAGSSGLNRNQVISALKSKFISVVSINLGNLDSTTTRAPLSCGASGSSSSGQGTAIASATGGAITGSSTGDIASKVINLVGGLKQTFEIQQNDCAGALSFTETPKFPVELGVGNTQRLDLRVKIERGICSRADPFICAISFTADRGLLIQVPFLVTNVAGC